jgi:hypothetical protein
MTRQQQNQTYDQKKGSADLQAVVNDVEQRDGPREAGATIPEQPGCGPNVTDYPGLGRPPAGDDAQSTGSDA